jgi:hypothetical protein
MLHIYERYGVFEKTNVTPVLQARLFLEKIPVKDSFAFFFKPVTILQIVPGSPSLIPIRYLPP